MLFHIEGDTLTIALTASEAFWALKRKIVVPREKIEQINWEAAYKTHRRNLGFRVGTAIPGRLFAGHYYGPNGENFLYMQRARGLFREIEAPHILVVELHDYVYRRLLLTVDDPDMATQIIAWWSKSG